MPDTATIRVTPALLQNGATRFVAEAITVRATSGRVHTALQTTGQDAAGLQIAGALSTCAERWSNHLMLGSLSLAGTGEQLARASADYTETEQANAGALTPPSGGGTP